MKIQMKHLSTRQVLAMLDDMGVSKHVPEMMTALRQVVDETEVLFARCQVAGLLPGLLIRLRTVPDIDSRAPGFRYFVQELQKLEPTTWIDEYALSAGNEDLVVGMSAQTSVVFGTYKMLSTKEEGF